MGPCDITLQKVFKMSLKYIEVNINWITNDAATLKNNMLRNQT